MLLFNRQLSSSVGGGGKDKGLWHHRQSHMPQQQFHGYLTEGQLPLLLASLAFAAQHIKIFDEGNNIFFSIESSLNPFFSSSFNNNFRTSGKKPHIICTNTNLQQQGGKRWRGKEKKPQNNNPQPPTPASLQQHQKKTPIFHMPKPLCSLLPAQPGVVSQTRTHLWVSSTQLGCEIKLLIFTPT